MTEQTGEPAGGVGGGRIRAVDRAVSVLELLADRGWVGVTDVARELGVHKSTAFRMLATLERRELVEQSAQTAKYRLGPALSRLGRAAATDPDVLRHSRPVLERLAAATGKTVNLAVLDGADVVYLEQVAGRPSVLGVNWLGRRTPLHATAAGKVLLAFMPDRLRKEHLLPRLDRLTPQTVTDPGLLEDQMAVIRRDGYGWTVEELELGLNAVAAAVRSGDGDVVAAVSVSGPASQIPPEDIEALGEMTRAAADDISRRLR
jgi:IclR family transcriptional regulator, acetate operon repressor